MDGTSSIALFVAVAGETVSRNDDVVAVLLICTVAAVISVGLVLRFCAVRYWRRQSPLALEQIAPTPAGIFDPPIRWLAVRTQHPEAVQQALGVQHVRACAWSDAVSPPFEPRLFISPPVKGWVLVMGCDLPDPVGDIDEYFHFLTRLSRQLGDVQCFVRHRAVAHHGWVRVNSGKVVRAYVWAGETLWNQGHQTGIERDLNVRCLNYTENPEAFGLAERELLALNSEKVVRIAAAWSLDPTAVGADLLESKGIAGDLLHWKLH